MTTATLTRRQGGAVPRAAFVVAVLLALLGIAVIVHARSVAPAAPVRTVVSGVTTEPHAHPGGVLRHGRVDSVAPPAVGLGRNGGLAERHRFGAGLVDRNSATTATSPSHGSHADQYTTAPPAYPFAATSGAGRRVADH